MACLTSDRVTAATASLRIRPSLVPLVFKISKYWYTKDNVGRLRLFASAFLGRRDELPFWATRYRPDSGHTRFVLLLTLYNHLFSSLHPSFTSVIPQRHRIV